MEYNGEYPELVPDDEPLTGEALQRHRRNLERFQAEAKQMTTPLQAIAARAAESWYTRPWDTVMGKGMEEQLANHILPFLQQAAAEERERCAKVCEELGRTTNEHPEWAETCAAAIRGDAT